MTFINKSTLLHLRIPFSFYLMPVYLFALSQANYINIINAILSFILLHLLIFPSSNGYNSYQDNDNSSIGGLKYPPKVTKNLFFVTVVMDLLAIAIATFISVQFSILILINILISRAYSYRKIRLKKNAVVGFVTVFIFQGAYVYMLSTLSITGIPLSQFFSMENIICMSIASFFMGGIYPLTQIYQHKADIEDGVTSLSYKLGYKGTFVFSIVLFSIATLLMVFYFISKNEPFTIGLFALIMLPVLVKFFRWFKKVRINIRYANYDNTMSMNFTMSMVMNSFFILIVINNQLSLFK